VWASHGRLFFLPARPRAAFFVPELTTFSSISVQLS